MVAGAIYFGDGKSATNDQQPTTESETEIQIAPITERDHTIGSKDAEIVIIEYSDTECPWCKVFHLTMQEIVATYGEKVVWVYRHMPFHSQSVKEAQATECAYEIGGNDAFWQYINELFEITPSNDGLDLALLPTIAENIGLNTSSFNECLSSQRHLDSITKNLELAKPGGIESTPYSVVTSKGGKRAIINGAESLTMVKAKIDALLK